MSPRFRTRNLPQCSELRSSATPAIAPGATPWRRPWPRPTPPARRLRLVSDKSNRSSRRCLGIVAAQQAKQLSLARLGALDVARLDVAKTAHLRRQRRDLKRDRVIFRAERNRKLAKNRFVVGDQAP